MLSLNSHDQTTETKMVKESDHIHNVINAQFLFSFSAKNQNHHLIPSQLPFEENAESSNFEALDGQSKADIGKVKTPTSRGRVIPLRLRCRRCGERFTAKSDYQIHLQSQVS